MIENSDYVALEEQAAAYRERVNQLESENDDLGGQISDLEDQVTELKSQVADLEASKIAAEELVADHTATLMDIYNTASKALS